MSRPAKDWKWFGNAGHLCVSNSCRFHLTTQVGKFLISTVGEYFPPGAKKPEPLGLTGLYETMVFNVSGRCYCGCGLPAHDGSELECVRYETAQMANRGHLKMCRKYDL